MDYLRISSTTQETSEYVAEHLHYPSLDSQFVYELTRQVQEVRGTVYHQIPMPPENLPDFELRHGAISPAEVMVALGSAGIFTAIYQAIASYLSRNQSRELTLIKGKVTITIKGHSLPEEKELLKQLAPELLPPAKKGKSIKRTKK